MNKARIGFIGAGRFISCHHLLTARDSEIMDIRAIADLNEELLNTHSKNLNLEYTTTDYKKILVDPEIDLVIIGTKQDLHAKMIVESLDAGKWAFCEKPMAETNEEAEEVLAAEKRNPGRLAIGFNRRFAPAYLETKRLMSAVKRPWFINYRLMHPNPGKREPNSFYATHERILYEGCHILDLVCWFLDAYPKRVVMTGDRYLNNCCLLDFDDGSQVSFMCGSMGAACLWKEYMEIFGEDTAITVSDFVDMRVRGFKGEFDRLIAPYLGEHAEEIEKYGFDFYETYRVDQLMKNNFVEVCPEKVKRPVTVSFDVENYGPVNPDLWGFVPNKGWIESLEHFAQCFLDGKIPGNADGRAGMMNTKLALALLESLESGQTVNFTK